MELPKIYSAKDYEDQIYELWEASGFFNPDNLPKSKKAFSIAMPPPNATGTLHIGHAMMLVLQDLMIRYHRMKGEQTLWLPGTDHASIATQNKVEKILEKEGQTRHSLGREAFLERINAYVEESRGIIRGQIRKLGSSCDWSRERYTLDEGLSRAVSEMFVRMHQDKLLYRDYRIVNWCPRCTSTLADDEVKHREEAGKLYFIKYPIRGTNASITVATTRPETMLGDAAVAVHPDDIRYKEFVGQVAVLPLENREIPVIAESHVEKDFGSGALKVTPAHDLNDFNLGKKYHLKTLKIFDDSGKVDLSELQKAGVDISPIASYQGMDRFAAREVIVKDLEKTGALEKIEELTHSVCICYRCDTVIEPYISLQWFVSVDTKIKRHNASLKELMLETVESGKTEIIPKRFEKTYFNWITNLRDWCVSRQIWFGHQLPVYYCEKGSGGCGETIVSVTPPAACSKCSNTALRRDQDTLDTWFSSGLWTFSTLGWPKTATEKGGKIKKTGDLLRFHPTSVLETGYDIIFFWVARMILMSRYALGEAPFKQVYLHGLVLDLNRKKMSKSHEETLIDPLDVIPKYGTDALRLSMLVGVTPGNDLLLNEEKIASYRNFVNKLWNVSRFILALPDEETSKKKTKTLADAWILSRLNRTIAEVAVLLESSRFSHAAEELRAFTWDDLADWYLEIAKIEGGKKWILLEILEKLVTLWHPFAPFVTEVLYQQIHPLSEIKGEKKHSPKLLMVHEWPTAENKGVVKTAERDFHTIRSLVQAIRNARAENAIAASQKIQAVFFSRDKAQLLTQNSHLLQSLCRLDFITVMESGERPTNALFLKVEDIEVYLPLGMLKIEEERARLGAEIERIRIFMKIITTRLDDIQFTQKAPAHIVQKERAKLAEHEEHIRKLEKQQKILR